MLNRKHGAWVNLSDSSSGSVRVARIQPGCISTSYPTAINKPVLTNGKIGRVSDTITIEPRTLLAEAEPAQE